MWCHAGPGFNHERPGTAGRLPGRDRSKRTSGCNSVVVPDPPSIESPCKGCVLGDAGDARGQARPTNRVASWRSGNRSHVGMPRGAWLHDRRQGGQIFVAGPLQQTRSRHNRLDLRRMRRQEHVRRVVGNKKALCAAFPPSPRSEPRVGPGVDLSDCHFSFHPSHASSRHAGQAHHLRRVVPLSPQDRTLVTPEHVQHPVPRCRVNPRHLLAPPRSRRSGQKFRDEVGQNLWNPHTVPVMVRGLAESEPADSSERNVLIRPGTAVDTHPRCGHAPPSQSTGLTEKLTGGSPRRCRSHIAVYAASI